MLNGKEKEKGEEILRPRFCWAYPRLTFWSTALRILCQSISILWSFIQVSEVNFRAFIYKTPYLWEFIEALMTFSCSMVQHSTICVIHKTLLYYVSDWLRNITQMQHNKGEMSYFIWESYEQPPKDIRIWWVTAIRMTSMIKMLFSIRYTLLFYKLKDRERKNQTFKYLDRILYFPLHDARDWTQEIQKAIKMHYYHLSETDSYIRWNSSTTCAENFWEW